MKYSNKNNLLNNFYPGTIVFKFKDFSYYSIYKRGNLEVYFEETEFVVIRDIDGEIVEIARKGSNHLTEKIHKNRLVPLNQGFS